MARTNPFEFLQQVRTEVAKVTWPTRRETVITTVMVLADVDRRRAVLSRRRLGVEHARHVRLGFWPVGANSSMAKRWYIVHAYSNFERKVAESIKERAAAAGLGDMFEEVLVPMEEVVEMRRGRKVSSERKFFPGYVLVKMDLNDETYHLIKATPKVTGFLGTENKPIPITDDEAGRILQQVQEGVERPKPSVTFEIGEQVRVADGPFASFNGLVEEVDEERARLKVAVSIFGRATPVELEYAQVEKL